MSKYEPQKFLDALNQKAPNKQLVCPYCGGSQFTTPKEFASLLINSEMSNINIGPTIPSGMIICSKCGHMDFFALGILNLLEKKEEKDSNG